MSGEMVIAGVVGTVIGLVLGVAVLIWIIDGIFK